MSSFDQARSDAAKEVNAVMTKIKTEIIQNTDEELTEREASILEIGIYATIIHYIDEEMEKLNG